MQPTSVAVGMTVRMNGPPLQVNGEPTTDLSQYVVPLYGTITWLPARACYIDLKFVGLEPERFLVDAEWVPLDDQHIKISCVSSTGDLYVGTWLAHFVFDM